MSESAAKPCAVPFTPEPRWGRVARRLAMPLAVGLGAGIVGSLTAASPLVGIGAAVAVALIGITLARPELGVVAGAFLLWSNAPTVAVREHGVPMPLAAGYVVLIFVPALHSILVQRRGLALTPALPWAGVLLGVSVLSAAMSREPARSLDAVVELALEGVLLYLLTVHAVRDRRTLRWVTWALLASGAFMGLVTLTQQVTGRFDLTFGGFGMTDSDFAVTGAQRQVAQARLAGPIGEVNRFGQIMLCLVALGVPAARAAPSRLARQLLLAATALSAVGAALTFSRGNAVAFVCLVACMLALGTVSRRQVGLLVAAGAVIVLALPQYRQRIATIATAIQLVDGDRGAARPDGAIRGRATQVLAAGLVFIDHPVLGVGPGLFPTYAQEYGNPLGIRRLKTEREAHSLLPHVAAETGSLGLFAFVAMLFVTLRALMRRAREATDSEDRELSSAYVLALLAYLLSGLFLHLSYLRYYWFLIALASAAAALPSRPQLAREATPVLDADGH